MSRLRLCATIAVLLLLNGCIGNYPQSILPTVPPSSPTVLTPTQTPTIQPTIEIKPTELPVAKFLEEAEQALQQEQYQQAVEILEPIYTDDKGNPKLRELAVKLVEIYREWGAMQLGSAPDDLSKVEQALGTFNQGLEVLEGSDDELLEPLRNASGAAQMLREALIAVQSFRESQAPPLEREPLAQAALERLDSLPSALGIDLKRLEYLRYEPQIAIAEAKEAQADAKESEDERNQLWTEAKQLCEQTQPLRPDDPLAQNCIARLDEKLTPPLAQFSYRQTASNWVGRDCEGTSASQFFVSVYVNGRSITGAKVDIFTERQAGVRVTTTAEGSGRTNLPCGNWTARLVSVPSAYAPNGIQTVTTKKYYLNGHQYTNVVIRFEMLR